MEEFPGVLRRPPAGWLSSVDRSCEAGPPERARTTRGISVTGRGSTAWSWERGAVPLMLGSGTNTSDAASPELVAYTSHPPGILARDREDGVGAYPCFFGFRFVNVSGSGSGMMSVLSGGFAAASGYGRPARRNPPFGPSAKPPRASLPYAAPPPPPVISRILQRRLRTSHRQLRTLWAWRQS